MLHRPLLRSLRLVAAAACTVAVTLPALTAPPASAAVTPHSALDKLTSSAKEELANGARADFWVRFDSSDLSGAAGIADRDQRGRAVYDALRTKAAAAQRGVRAELAAAGADYTPYWISNAVLVHDGTLALATSLAKRAEVTQIRPPAAFTRAVPRPQSGAWHDTGEVAWGIQAINADEVWAEGYDGHGITVANIDTGVALNHPALHDRYRGLRPDGTLDNDYNFADVAHGCPTSDPCDYAGHGTHTMGTMLGSAPGHQIGVAPGADWIAVNGCAGVMCTDAQLMRSAQWIVAPTRVDGSDPDPTKRPDVVNNSWSGDPGGGGDPFFDDILDAWDASGIFSSWSSGNAGPGCDTAGAPGARAKAYSVGAYGHTGEIAFFSSRGPGQDGRVKPDIAAPGMGVVSAMVGDVPYIAEDGTSMAAPHVAGAVALLWSAHPELVGDIAGTRALLDGTAHDVDDTTCGGTAADNGSWGEGMLDVAAMVAGAPVTFGALTGTAVDGSGAPVKGVVVTAEGELDRNGWGTDDGAFSVPLRPGTYQVTVSAFGYAPQTREVVVPADGGAVTLGQVALEPAPRHTVSGRLTQRGSGAPVVDAPVRMGYDLPVATVAADGSFTFTDVPEGTYVLDVDPGACGASLTRTVVVDGDETLHLVQSSTTPTGYVGCRTVVGGFHSGTDEQVFGGPTKFLTQPLPFAFPWFGKLASTIQISSEGYLRFDPGEPDPRFTYPYDNGKLPDGNLEAAIAPFFDALDVDRVYTGTTTVDGRPAYVVEWRDAKLDSVRHRDMGEADAEATLDFSVTLTADGDAIIGWGDGVGASPLTSGSSATIAFQSDPGGDGLNTYFGWANKPVATAGRGFRIDSQPWGTVRVELTDHNDGMPLAGATVEIDGEATGTTITTDSAGVATAQVPLGSHTVTTAAAGYVGETASVEVATVGQVGRVQQSLRTGRAAVRGQGLSPKLAAGQSSSGSVTVDNTGEEPMTVSLAETVSDPASPVAGAPVTALPAPDAESAAVTRTATVLTRFDAPFGNSGVATDGTSVWTNELYGMRISRHTLTGEKTGEIVAPWERSDNLAFTGDITYDSRTGDICQAVHGATGGEIRCYSRTDGSVDAILHGSWEGANPGGIAYNAEDDVFYLGGHQVFTVAGTTHPHPGKLLHSCASPEPQIRGLGYNPSTGQLWVGAEHAEYGSIRAGRHSVLLSMAPGTCTVTGEVTQPALSLGGLDVDGSGRIWAVDLSLEDVFLLDVDDVVARDVPWLSVPAGTVTLAAGESRTFPVQVDAGKARAGVQTAEVVVRTSAGRDTNTLVPVHLEVPKPAPGAVPAPSAAFQVGIDVGSRHPFRDASGFTWSADRKATGSRWGFEGRTRVLATKRAIAGTTADRLFRSARVATGKRFAYRFPTAPAGTYAIDLGLAGIDRVSRQKRLFDVVVDGRTVLRNVDPAKRGVRRALTRTLRIRHAGGPLTVAFVGRRHGARPLVSTLRITWQRQ